MELPAKLAILADAAKYDASCASSGSQRSNRGRGLGDTNKIGLLANYGINGVEGTTGIAGIIGVAVTFAIGFAIFAVVRRRRKVRV